MKSPKFFPAFFALLMPFPLLAQEAKPQSEGAVILKPEFFPGKIYNYVTNTTVTMQPPARPGQAPPPERQVSMEHHARLKTAGRSEGSGVSVEASTDQLKMEISAGAKQMRYDSKDPAAAESNEAKVLARHFESATKRSVDLDLDENGVVVNSVEKGGGGPATPLPGLPQFGPEQLKQLVAGMIQGFPPDPVKPGDEWVQKRKRPVGQFGEIDFDMTYRYIGDEEFEGAQCARIEFAGTIKGDLPLAGSVPGSASGKLAFEGTELKGRLMFDKLRKAVRLSEQNVKISVDVPVPGSSTGTLRLPVRQSVTSKLTALQDS